MSILGQAAIPHFPMAEQILQNVERMFDKGSHCGFALLHRLEGFFLCAFGQRFDRTTLARDLPVDLSFQGHDLG